MVVEKVIVAIVNSKPRSRCEFTVSVKGRTVRITYYVPIVFITNPFEYALVLIGNVGRLHRAVLQRIVFFDFGVLELDGIIPNHNTTVSKARQLYVLLYFEVREVLISRTFVQEVLKLIGIRLAYICVFVALPEYVFCGRPFSSVLSAGALFVL